MSSGRAWLAGIGRVAAVVSLLLGAAVTPLGAQAAAYDVAWISVSVAPTMITSGDYGYTAVIRNDGTLTWNAGGPLPVHASYHWYDPGSGTYLVYDGARSPLPEDVSPGETVTVNGVVRAPNVRGSFQLIFDLVQEGVTWFSTQRAGNTRTEVVRIEPLKGAAYSALSAYSNGGVLLPWIEENNVHQTGVAVMNPSTTETITITDVPGGPIAIPPLASRFFYSPQLGWPQGAKGTMLLRSARDLMAATIINGVLVDADAYSAFQLTPQHVSPSDEAAAAAVDDTVRVHRATAKRFAGRVQRVRASGRPAAVPSPTVAPEDAEQAVEEDGVRPQAPAGTTLYVPVLQKNLGANRWNSALYVANTSTVAAAKVTIDLFESNGNGQWQIRDIPVPAGGIQVIDSQTAFFGVPDNIALSAVVRATEGLGIGVIVQQYRADGYDLAYEAFSGGTPVVSLPLQFKGFGPYDSGIQVQNAGHDFTFVTLEIYPRSGGQPFVYQQLIAPGDSYTWDLRNPSQVPNLPTNFVGNAVVRSNNGQPLVAITNELRAGETLSLSYSGLTQGSGTIYAPFIARYRELWAANQRYSTGLQVQNLSSFPVDIVVEYRDGNGVLVHQATAQIPVNGSVTFDHRHESALPVAPGWVGGAIVRATTPEGRIGAIVNVVNY